MKITRLKFVNCAGIPELEVTPGAVTVFQGKNGSGKSSALKGLRSLFPFSRNASFAKLLPIDAHEGEITAWTDDDLKIVRELSISGRTPLKIKRGKWEVEGAKAFDYLQDGIDVMSINAEKLLTCSEKERKQTLFEALPLSLDMDRLREILPDFRTLEDEHPLQSIDRLRKTIYDERTLINRQQKEKAHTAKQMIESFPALIPLDGIEAQIAELERIRDEVEEKKLGRVTRAATKRDMRVQEAKDHGSQEADRIKNIAAVDISELQAAIRKCEQERDEQVQSLRESASSEIRQAEIEYQNEESLASIEAEEAIGGLKEDLAGLRAKRDEQVRTEVSRKVAARSEHDAEVLKEESDRMTQKLDAVDAYKLELMKGLPVSGITIEDGEILIDGKPWDQNPESRIARLAIDVGTSRGDTMGIVIMDGLESLDDDNFERFTSEVAATGKQLFCARVTKEDFNVRTID